jgi:hypothetical protein
MLRDHVSTCNANRVSESVPKFAAHSSKLHSQFVGSCRIFFAVMRSGIELPEDYPTEGTARRPKLLPVFAESMRTRTPECECDRLMRSQLCSSNFRGVSAQAGVTVLRA